MVEALVADRAHESLGERVRTGRADRGANRLDADRGEDLVEASGELGIPIADEERLVALTRWFSDLRLHARRVPLSVIISADTGDHWPVKFGVPSAVGHTKVEQMAASARTREVTVRRCCSSHVGASRRRSHLRNTHFRPQQRCYGSAGRAQPRPPELCRPRTG
jgi:hypothetical protein